MYVVILAIEALRLANKYAGKREFDWVLVSDDGKPIEASNRMRIDCDASIGDERDLPYAFVVAGDDQTQPLTGRLRRELIRIGRSKTILGAIDSGVFLLAECRLIRGRSVAVHPAAMAAFSEKYPDVPVLEDAIVWDGSLLTCAGGMSTVGLMLSVIRKHCSKAIARSVADDMVAGVSSYGIPMMARRRTKSHAATTIDDIVELMQLAIEEPISLRALSSRTGLSRRHITRIFRQNLGRAPMHYYRTLRLNHAKQLLFQSDLAISKIAVASGFRSLSAFSRRFSAEFGRSPRNLLSSLRKDGNASAVPAHNSIKHVQLRSGGYLKKS
jgi:AraC family carnitine catabolism transcriptional activator